MPIYEYRMQGLPPAQFYSGPECEEPASTNCRHCGSAEIDRLMSRFAAPQIGSSPGLESLTDPEGLGGLDEQDPESMARLMKNEMGEEMARIWTSRA